VLYSVEQLPRCDLLRLSPTLGDSSCRLDETPHSYVFRYVTMQQQPRTAVDAHDGPYAEAATMLRVRPSMRTTVVRAARHGTYEKERKKSYSLRTAIDAHDGRT
jgi:hypothetical protein